MKAVEGGGKGEGRPRARYVSRTEISFRSCSSPRLTTVLMSRGL